MFLRSVLLLALAAAPERLSLEEAVRRAVVRNPSSLAAQQEIASHQLHICTLSNAGPVAEQRKPGAHDTDQRCAVI